MAELSRAMVLCAGYGTRLRPLSDELPKPLLPVGDASLLAHIVARLRAAGIVRVVMNSHHLPHEMQRAAAELDAELIHEPDILGTAGGVRHAAAALGSGPLLVVNGDIAASLDIAKLWRAHCELDPHATLAVAAVGPAGSGTVGIGASGDVVRLRGERFGQEIAGAEFVGAQILSPAARAELREQGCLVGDLYLPALRRGLILRATPAADRFWDIGTPATYLDCNLDWLAKRALGSWTAGSVTRGIELRQAIVGRGASVVGSGALWQVVVWPGARAVAPLENAIVTPQRIVAVGEKH